MLKTQLTPADKETVWKVIGDWLHYYWKDGRWWIAPCDPRRNRMLTNTRPAFAQEDGIVTDVDGFEAVV